MKLHAEQNMSALLLLRAPFAALRKTNVRMSRVTCTCHILSRYKRTGLKIKLGVPLAVCLAASRGSSCFDNQLAEMSGRRQVE